MIFLTVLFISGCSKKDTPHSLNCTDISVPPSAGVLEAKPAFKAPYFNPINQSEIIFHYLGEEDSKRELIKYNLHNEEFQVLFSGINIISQPKWNWNGSIICDNLDYNLYSVSESGEDSLQISTGFAHLYPFYDRFDPEIHYSFFSPELGFPYYFLKYDGLNQSADTIYGPESSNQGYVSNGDISNKNSLAAITLVDNNVALAEIPLETFEINQLLNLQAEFNDTRVAGLCWSTDGNGIFFSMPTNGLYYFDLNSYELDVIKPACLVADYANITASPDGTFIIVEKITRELKSDFNGIPGKNLVRTHSLSKIYLDTFQEVPLAVTIQ